MTLDSTRTGVAPTYRNAMRWTATYHTVEQRLAAAGAIEELHHLHRMSLEELDLLVQLERGAGPTVAVHNEATPSSAVLPSVVPTLSTAKSTRCPSGSPQAGRGRVAKNKRVIRKEAAA